MLHLEQVGPHAQGGLGQRLPATTRITADLGGLYARRQVVIPGTSGKAILLVDRFDNEGKVTVNAPYYVWIQHRNDPEALVKLTEDGSFRLTKSFRKGRPVWEGGLPKVREGWGMEPGELRRLVSSRWRDLLFPDLKTEGLSDGFQRVLSIAARARLVRVQTRWADNGGSTRR